MSPRRRHRGPSDGLRSDWGGHAEGLLFLAVLGAATALVVWLAVHGTH